MTLPLATIRSAFGIAFQEVFLFNATIYENLRYAKPNAKREEVERVCRLTGADEVIERLPKGFETRLSDFGVELSRGEKQRITLARALLKDAPILIFDEATASIDRESSHTIMETISANMTDQTIIMVTHEAYLLDMVDRVICIRDGQICFDGAPNLYLAREFGGSFSEHSSPLPGSFEPDASDGQGEPPVEPDESRPEAQSDDMTDTPTKCEPAVEPLGGDTISQPHPDRRTNDRRNDRRSPIGEQAIWTKEDD